MRQARRNRAVRRTSSRGFLTPVQVVHDAHKGVAARRGGIVFGAPSLRVARLLTSTENIHSRGTPFTTNTIKSTGWVGRRLHGEQALETRHQSPRNTWSAHGRRGGGKRQKTPRKGQKRPAAPAGGGDSNFFFFFFLVRHSRADTNPEWHALPACPCPRIENESNHYMHESPSSKALEREGSHASSRRTENTSYSYNRRHRSATETL